MIGILLFGIPAAIIAGVKGFKSLRWLLALGIIGFITVICLSSAKTSGITTEEAQKRAAKADSVGAVMAWINICLAVVAVIFVLAVK